MLSDRGQWTTIGCEIDGGIAIGCEIDGGTAIECEINQIYGGRWNPMNYYQCEINQHGSVPQETWMIHWILLMTLRDYIVVWMKVCLGTFLIVGYQCLL